MKPSSITNVNLEMIEEYAVMGLNSENPKHWEAALQDVLDIVRRTRQLRSK